MSRYLRDDCRTGPEHERPWRPHTATREKPTVRVGPDMPLTGAEQVKLALDLRCTAGGIGDWLSRAEIRRLLLLRWEFDQHTLGGCTDASTR